MPAGVGGSVGLGPSALPSSLAPHSAPGAPRSVSRSQPPSPPCSPTPSTLPGAHISTHKPSCSPRQTQAHTAASKPGAPLGLPLPFLPPLDLPGVSSVPWASECPMDEKEAASFGRAAWAALAGSRARNHPSRGRAHLHLASLEGSGEAGRAGGAQSLWGPLLLYL